MKTSEKILLAAGGAVAVLCFLTLTGLMAYMKRRQEKREQALENE